LVANELLAEISTKALKTHKVAEILPLEAGVKMGAPH
jgi:hypothetical protein